MGEAKTKLHKKIVNNKRIKIIIMFALYLILRLINVFIQF